MLTFAPVNFETETLAAGLAAAGFDAAAPALFAWLGVVIYLTREAVLDTLAWIGALPGGAEVVFDYGVPLSAYPADQRAYHARREARVAAMGEPWITRFESGEMAGLLQARGFTEIEDLGPAAIARRFYGLERPDGAGPHLIRASTMGP